MYAVPGSSFQGSSIQCDAIHACVFYVGENYNDFTVSHVFSNPFLVDTQSFTSASTTSVAVGSSENFQAAVIGSRQQLHRHRISRVHGVHAAFGRDLQRLGFAFGRTG